MSKRAFKVREHVWGQLGTPAGAVTFDIEPGTVSPSRGTEEAVLLHLAGLGHAEIVTPAKSTKQKEA